MSDEDILVGGETASAPTDIPAAPPPPSTDPQESKVTEGRHAVLSQLAKDESIEGYAAERQDQEAYFDRGEKLDERRDAAWFRRAHKALQDATLEAQGFKLNEQGEPEAPQVPPGFVDGREVNAAVENARKEGAAAMRVQQYFGSNTERKEEITAWHRAMDPESKIAQWCIDNESAYVPQIMEKLADNPQALQELAEMPASQRHRWLGALEGHIAAEQNFARQMQQQLSEPQVRRHTQAPPPIRPPRGGGANVPQDLHSLASRGENVDAYVKMRQQMEKRRD